MLKSEERCILQIFDTKTKYQSIPCILRIHEISGTYRYVKTKPRIWLLIELVPSDDFKHQIREISIWNF